MKQHKFEKSGLGKAPYQLVGYRYSPVTTDQNGVKVSGNGNCMHCGRPIAHIYICKSSDGIVFELGCVCVDDLHDTELSKAVKAKDKEVKNDARKEKLEVSRQAQYEAEKKAEQEALVKIENEFEAVKPELEKRPHPNAYFASQGKTLLDYVLYFLRPIEESWHPHYKLEVWHKYQVLAALREVGAKI